MVQTAEEFEKLDEEIKELDDYFQSARIVGTLGIVGGIFAHLYKRALSEYSALDLIGIFLLMVSGTYLLAQSTRSYFKKRDLFLHEGHIHWWKCHYRGDSEAAQCGL